MNAALPPDAILAQVYGQLKIPADRLGTDRILFEQFISALPEEYQPTDERELKQRILNLRKQGKLPRTKG